jgi:hypothetical protein
MRGFLVFALFLAILTSCAVAGFTANTGKEIPHVGQYLWYILLSEAFIVFILGSFIGLPDNDPGPSTGIFWLVIAFLIGAFCFGIGYGLAYLA